MDRKLTKRVRREAVLAAIARREWLVQMLALAAAGCGRREAALRRNSTLIIAWPGGERDMNALDGNGSKCLVFLSLVTENESGELEGRLAESWAHSPDYRDWTFHLRKNVRWHDGVPVTAHDVKFALELLAHPDVHEIGPEDVELITVLDDSTVKLRFPGWGSTQNISGYEVALPKHLLDHLDPKKHTEWDFWTRPVGNGPYRFVRHVPQTMMEFEANPDYYRGKPRIERVVLKFVQNAAPTELLSGNVDIIVGASPRQTTALDASFRVYSKVAAQIHGGIFWQHAHPLLRDVGVRRALTLAIDRRELLQLLNLPARLPVLDGPFTLRQLRRGELPEALPYDPAQARRLLDATGWRQRSRDDIRERDGRSCTFTLLVVNRPSFSEIAVYIQAALRRIGVGMDVQIADRGVVQERIRAKQFDAVLSPIVSGVWDWRRWFGEQSPLGYRSTTAVRLLERWPLASGPAEEDDVRRQLTDLFRAELPATFLFPRVETELAHRRVRGLSNLWRADPVQFVDELWLDDRAAQ